MSICVKDFATWIPKECRDLFSDKDGDDRVSLALVDAKAFDDANRRLRFVASDDSVDLHDEIVDPGAFHELRGTYLACPVILSGHAHRLDNGFSPAIARAVELHTNRNPLVGTAQFGTKDYINAVSLDVWNAYRGGNQFAFSVGFRSRDMEKRDGRWVHTKALLLEISGVPVPANSNALVLNYVMGRLAQLGVRPTTDRGVADEVVHMLRELEERMKAMETIIVPDAVSAGSKDGDAGDDPNADGINEEEVAECFGRAVGASGT